MIRFQTIGVTMPALDVERVREWIVAVVSNEGYRVGELHYYFCSDEVLLDINQSRLGHDFYTDIVTFPLVEGTVLSGEFCLSLDRIAENAVTFGRSFESELSRVMIHGVLHMMGYDDHTDADRQQMRSKEDESLKLLFN